MKINQDRIRGTLYGQAIGDALGVQAEFIPKVQLTLPTGNLKYKTTYHGATVWKPGEYTDDTSQAVCLLEAYLSGIEISGRSSKLLPDPLLIAHNFVRWVEEDGRGMGAHTYKVLTDMMYKHDPLTVSKYMWEQSGKESAPNGAVMRTSYVGVMRPDNQSWTEEAAELCAQVTHYDPRCVAGAVGMSVMIAKLIQGVGITKALQQVSYTASLYSPYAHEWIGADKSLSGTDIAAAIRKLGEQ